MGKIGYFKVTILLTDSNIDIILEMCFLSLVMQIFSLIPKVLLRKSIVQSKTSLQLRS